MERDKALADLRVSSHKDISELSGILHQLKQKMIDSGLVSAEDLEEYKKRNIVLSQEIEKLNKMIMKRNSENGGESSPISPSRKKENLSGLAISQRSPGKIAIDENIQCVLERTTSPEKMKEEIYNSKYFRGIGFAGIFEDFSAGYIESLVIIYFRRNIKNN